MSRRASMFGIAAAVVALAVAAVLLLRQTPPAAAPAGTTPSLAVRGPRVYREKLEGSLYVNQDLGLRIAAPADWTPSLGKRSDDLPAYEGLVLKMESRRDPEPETQFRPLVSVFKKTLPPSPSQDPVAYIRTHLVSPPKKVTDSPKLATVAGRMVGSVSYEMPAAQGFLKVRQIVRIVNSEVIIVTAFVPVRNDDEVSPVIDRILNSIDWSS